MQLVPTIVWKITEGADEPLDQRLIPLLCAIHDTGSVKAAAVACGISYRAAWGLLREYRQKLNAPLVGSLRSRSTRLTPLGAQVVHAHATATKRLNRPLSTLAVRVRLDFAANSGRRSAAD